MRVITLDQKSPAIIHLCKRDKRLAKVISIVGPITYMTYEGQEFSFLVREIIEQMLSKKAAENINQRLVDLCGGTVTPEIITQVSNERIQSIGTSKPKVTYIKNLAQAVATGTVDFKALKDAPNHEVIKALTSVKGISLWTAKMYLIFVLDRQDILPYEDVAFLRSYKWMYKTEDTTPAAIKKKCQKWAPYISTGSRYLYRALDMGLTKNEFHLFK